MPKPPSHPMPPSPNTKTSGIFVTAVMREPGEVLQVPMVKLQELVAEDRALGDLILRACIIRRSILIELGTGMKILGSHYSPDARRILDFVARNRIPHRWFDVEDDEHEVWSHAAECKHRVPSDRKRVGPGYSADQRHRSRPERSSSARNGNHRDTNRYRHHPNDNHE